MNDKSVTIPVKTDNVTGKKYNPYNRNSLCKDVPYRSKSIDQKIKKTT
jgi:hypothetical protein